MSRSSGKDTCISIWGTEAYKSMFGSVTFSSCPFPAPNSSRKQGLPLFSMPRTKLLRENGLELDIVWQLKSHQGKILTQETGLPGGVRTDLEQAQAGQGAGVSFTFPGLEHSEQAPSDCSGITDCLASSRILGRVHFISLLTLWGDSFVSVRNTQR